MEQDQLVPLESSNQTPVNFLNVLPSDLIFDIVSNVHAQDYLALKLT